MNNNTPNTDNKQPEELNEVVDTAVENTEVAAAEPETTKKEKFSLFKKQGMRSADVKRRLRHGRTATLITVGVVVLTLMFNLVFYVLGERFPFTVDLSSDGVFSLSEESIEVAKKVKSPIEIAVFMSEEAFSNPQSSAAQSYTGGYEPLTKIFTEFYNALKLYGSYSDNRVSVKFIDMNLNPTVVNQYAAYKGETVEEMDILFINGDRCETIKMDDLFSFDSYTHEITTSDVEKVLASQIQTVQSQTERVLTIFTGHSEDGSVVNNLTSIYDLNGYEIEQVDLTRSAEINKNTLCAIIPAPSTDYSDESIKRLREWLHNDGKEGRNLLVFAHPTADCPNLYEFLSVEYGLEVTDNIVSETDMNRVYSYNPYFHFADIPATEFTKNGVGDGKALFVNTRQIIPHWEEKTDTSTQYSVNLVTFADSAKLVSLKDAKDNTNPTAQEYDGTVVGMAASVKHGFQNALQTETLTRVIVCGSAYSMDDSLTTMTTVENENLYLDVMTALSGADDLINISSKSMEEETISFATTTQLWVGLVLFTILLPLILLLIGLFVFLKRRHL